MTAEIDLNRCPVDMTEVEPEKHVGHMIDGSTFTQSQVTLHGVTFGGYHLTPHEDGTLTVAGAAMQPHVLFMLAEELMARCQGVVERTGPNEISYIR